MAVLRGRIAFAGVITQHLNHAVKRGAVVVSSPSAFDVQHRQTTVAVALNPDRLVVRGLTFLNTIPIRLLVRGSHVGNLHW